MTDTRPSLMPYISLVAWAATMVMFVLVVSPWATAGPSAGGQYCTLSKERICIDSAYSGDSVEVSGLVEPGAEVIVKVTSPATDLKLARKGKVGPIWMNVADVEFGHAPAFYQVNSSRALGPVLSSGIQERLGLGYQGLKSQIKVSPAREDNPTNYKELISLKESEGLYRVQPASVQVSPDGTFHTRFNWPSNAPTGNYTVTTYQVKNGQVVHEATADVNLEKVGLIRWLADLSHDNGAAYGILAIASALGAGLVVGFVFKGAKAH